MVTIIVPVYNISEYLPACVESLRNQTHPDLEIILVDDGSADGSSVLCDAYARQDCRIQVIHKANGGLSSARNAGLDAASGQWILFVDGDDYLAPNAVELLLNVAQGHADADFIQFHYQETDGSWQQEVQNPEQAVLTEVPDFFRQLYDLGGVAASACTKLFRKDLFDSLRFQECIRHEDEELTTRLLPLCHKAVYTKLVLYGYVMRQGSIIHSNFSPKAMDIFPIMDRRISVLEQLGCTDLATETRRRMFQTAAWLYCLARKNGFRPESAQLKQRILAFSKENDLPLRGQYLLLHRLARISPAAVELYYFVRRLTGKT